MTDHDDKPVIKREGGRFVKGQSGNPAGRAKGTKNKITLARLLLEEQLRDALAKSGPKLMQQAIKQALKGNDRIMRVLLDKMLTTPRDAQESDNQDREINVVVQNLVTDQSAKPKLIEGEKSVRVPVTIPIKD